jgi:CDP-diacylglycerol---glycerol-3-phosphate 3-phosphatidyltransferase
MTPNQITALRVAAAFAAVALFMLFGRHLVTDFVAVGLTVAAIALDGLDGYVARTRGLSTSLGAQFDILGDRIVENLFFTFFAVTGLISIWIPILFFVRGTLTDFLRGLGAQRGRIGFGREGMLETRWGRALVASRVSRASYAVLKCVCFCYLGLLLPLPQMPGLWPGMQARIFSGGRALVTAAAVFCVVRAVPVLWEGRSYLTGMQKRARPIALELGR